MKSNKYIQFALILVMTPFLGGCFTTQPKQTTSTRERIMQEYLSKIVRSDGIDAREAVLLARSEVVFRSLERQYNLKQPLLEDYDRENYSVQFFSSNKSLRQMFAGATVKIIINKETGHLYLEEDYAHPGRYNEAS